MKIRLKNLSNKILSKIVVGGGLKVFHATGNTVIRASSGATSEGPAVTCVGGTGLLNLVVKHSSWVAPTAYPEELKTETGDAYVHLNSAGLTVSDGVFSAIIDYSTLSAKGVDLTLREIDVCEGGVAKKMLILASAAY